MPASLSSFRRATTRHRQSRSVRADSGTEFSRHGHHRRFGRRQPAPERSTSTRFRPSPNRAGTGATLSDGASAIDDLAPDQTGAQFWWSGTSFSAPTISGAVALMAQAFPNLTRQQIVEHPVPDAPTTSAPPGRIDLRPRPAEYRDGVPTDRHDQPRRTANAGQPDNNGDLRRRPATQPRPVARRDHPRRLRPRLRPQSCGDAAPADVDQPLSRALQNDVRVAARQRRPDQHRDDGQRAPRPRAGFRARAPGIGPEDAAQVAADRRLGGRPDRQQDRLRVRLCRRRQGDGAAPDGRRAAAPS